MALAYPDTGRPKRRSRHEGTLTLRQLRVRRRSHRPHRLRRDHGPLHEHAAAKSATSSATLRGSDFIPIFLCERLRVTRSSLRPPRTLRNARDHPAQLSPARPWWHTPAVVLQSAVNEEAESRTRQGDPGGRAASRSVIAHHLNGSRGKETFEPAIEIVGDERMSPRAAAIRGNAARIGVRFRSALCMLSHIELVFRILR
jgi:hypothetical protein